MIPISLVHSIRVIGGVAACLVMALPATAADWHVAPDGRGTGTAAAPFGRIQLALVAAQPGDVVHVRAGTYRERLQTIRHGQPNAVITIRSTDGRGSVIVTSSGRVLTVDHAYFTVEGLVLDGEYGTSDAVRVSGAAHHFTLRRTEVRRSSRDLLDIAGPTGVLIEDCLIHRALNAGGGRTDAHGIAAGPVQQLTIRNTDIHTFSGDGVQVDPGRSAPGWNDVTLDGVRIWLEPLATAENGFPAGTVPGENAIDTKAAPNLPRARIIIRNVTAWGFQNGLITNMAAFNLKEHIDARLDGVTVFDSQIAFRLRGGGRTGSGAWVTVTNGVVHSVGTAYRYEDNIQRLRIWNNTVGRDVVRPFQAAASGADGVNVRNLLMMEGKAREAKHPSNLVATDGWFVDASQHDYRLAADAPALDAGIILPEVAIDRDGVERPVGRAPDVGAYERTVPSPASPGLLRQERVDRLEQQRGVRRSFDPLARAWALVEQEEQRHRPAPAEQQLAGRPNLKRNRVVHEPRVVMQHVQGPGRDARAGRQDMHRHLGPRVQPTHLFADKRRAIRDRKFRVVIDALRVVGPHDREPDLLTGGGAIDAFRPVVAVKTPLAPGRGPIAGS